MVNFSFSNRLLKGLKNALRIRGNVVRRHFSDKFEDDPNKINKMIMVPPLVFSSNTSNLIIYCINPKIRNDSDKIYVEETGYLGFDFIQKKAFENSSQRISQDDFDNRETFIADIFNICQIMNIKTYFKDHIDLEMNYQTENSDNKLTIKKFSSNIFILYIKSKLR